MLLGANLQTSFMHPPFGFALFYLRGIAPKEVKSSDIYWGAIPWVVLQLILVSIVIAFPQLVTSFIDKGPAAAPPAIEIPAEPAATDAATEAGKGGVQSEEDRAAAELEKAIRNSK